jgi:hypothetical protein
LSDTRRRIAQLEARLREDPAAPVFAALAELQRREGRLDVAERILRDGLAHDPASAQGRAVALLVLADAGRSDELRRRLEAWAGEAADTDDASAPAADAAAAAPMLFPEAEFEQAFASAEPELDAMITPDSVAEEAALRADGLYGASAFESGGAFSTRTMADLLERQGDREGAARIRAKLTTPAPEATPAAKSRPAAEPPVSPRDTTLAELERWLERARSLQS